MKRAKRIAKLIDILRDAQVMADSMNLVNGSGGEIGSLVGSIADELEVNNPNAEFVRAFTENKHGELA